MKSHGIAALIAVSIAVIMSAALAVPGVRAGAPGWYTLNDDASPADFNFMVYSPGTTSLESDYLNFTVYSEPVTSGHGTNATWYVLVNIYDGTTNYSWNKSLAVKNDLTVYNNISMADPGSTFVENGTADLTIQVQKANWAITDVEVDTFGIYTTEIGAVLGAMIPIIITVAIFAAILPMVKKIGGKKR